MIQVKSHIASMGPYKPPWTGLDRSRYLRLDLNENTLNPPDHVKLALKSYIDSNCIQMYPEYETFMTQLSTYAQVDSDRLILTNGSDQAIELLLHAFLGSGDTMLIARPEFPIFTQIAAVLNAKVLGISFDKNLDFPMEAFVEAITPSVSLIVLINPNNPTGTPLELGQLELILKSCPDIPVIVDEAYYEYTQITACGLIENYPNLIITRTFSKAFAMAGLRLGYVIANPEIISQLYKIRGPFDVNSCAIVAAQSQLDRPDSWKAYIKEIVTRSKPFLENFFDEQKVKYYPGAAHFMLVQPRHRDQAVNYLKAHGILVRPMFAPSIEKTFRMCVGSLEQTQQFAAVYEKYLQEFDS
ncbi:MAG: histidinol-phosphate transaminase [Desulfobacterales bacterium]